MSTLQEQAVQMIGGLSDDNVGFLIELMQRFMLSKDTDIKARLVENTKDKISFMQEMEAMRIRAKFYFPADFEKASMDAK